MKSYTLLILAGIIVLEFALSESTLVAKNAETAAPTIAVTKLDINDKNLKLRYEIRNESEQDIWVLIGFEQSGSSAELFVDKDDRTLLIRRRFDVPFSGGGSMLHGRYVVMRTGETQAESVTLAVPVHPEYQFVDGKTRRARGLEYATRLAIEVGYYVSDLPAIIRSTLEEVDRIGMKIKTDDDRKRLFYFGGLLYFNALSEGLRQRDEEVLLPYTYQWFKGEQVLRTVVEDVRIPYEEKEKDWSTRRSIDIPPCTRVEIEYRPSMLEYFFPYTGQQSLLSPAEKQYLQSMKTIVVQDHEDLTAFVSNINEGLPLNGIVRARTIAQVVCYHDDEHVTSFPICNDYSVVIDFRDRFTYDDGFPSLRRLTPQIQPLELRIQCAVNLRDLWHRLRLYYKACRRIETLYPVPAKWCDAMMRAYKDTYPLEDIKMPHKCPSASAGESHYAMNPNCKFDSAPDTVLLFEAKAGWNQHGGPELFTFDNHEPRGGCVLLNDGTVKFICTKEELQQLRWK